MRVFDRIPVLKFLFVRPRLMIAIVFSGVVAFMLPEHLRIITKSLIAWDASVALYLGMSAVMVNNSDHAMIRRRAALLDEGGLVILGLTVVGAVASLAAIMAELIEAKGTTGHVQWQAIILAAATVFLSWVFMQSIFALHYAHEFYNNQSRDGQGGLEFPAKYQTPNYMDFFYFSFIIGTAAQTADINITSTRMRQIVTLHCVIVFFFNTTILALAINVGASLL